MTVVCMTVVRMTVVCMTVVRMTVVCMTVVCMTVFWCLEKQLVCMCLLRKLLRFVKYFRAQTVFNGLQYQLTTRKL